MDEKNYKTVDEYINTFPPKIQKVLKEIRQTIRRAAPQAEEMISYRMPAYKFEGKPLVYFAAFEKHLGFYPTPRGISSFEKELSKYQQGKGSVQFPLDQPMPLDLIRRIVAFRMQNLAEK